MMCLAGPYAPGGRGRVPPLLRFFHLLRHNALVIFCGEQKQHGSAPPTLAPSTTFLQSLRLGMLFFLMGCSCVLACRCLKHLPYRQLQVLIALEVHTACAMMLASFAALLVQQFPASNSLQFWQGVSALVLACMQVLLLRTRACVAACDGIVPAKSAEDSSHAGIYHEPLFVRQPVHMSGTAHPIRTHVLPDCVSIFVPARSDRMDDDSAGTRTRTTAHDHGTPIHKATICKVAHHPLVEPLACFLDMSPDSLTHLVAIRAFYLVLSPLVC